MDTQTPDIRTVIDRFNEAFQTYRPELLSELVAEDCVIENTVPAPDGQRHAGREACVALWQAIASDLNSRFDVEEVRLLHDHALVFWRYHWGVTPADSVRGVNVMRVNGGKIVEARGYVKQVRREAAG